MRYLLDTNIVSDLIRNPQGNIAKRIAELRYGATKKGSARLSAQIEAVLGSLEILPFEPPADRAYGTIRAQLEKSGSTIGGNDLLIAAQALTLGYTIVTGNEAEYARVENLPRENWLRSISS